MKVWIDKQGGRHFHRETCALIKEPHYHYEAIEADIYMKNNRWQEIKVDGQTFIACLCMYIASGTNYIHHRNTKQR